MGQSIVVVKDEPTLRPFVARNLKARGQSVKQVWTVTEGITILLEHSPDLMIHDINLHDGRGWDVLRKLSKPPIIIISTSRVSES